MAKKPVKKKKAAEGKPKPAVKPDVSSDCPPGYYKNSKGDCVPDVG